MPTLMEIELRAQLARRDERILELEKLLEQQTFRADKFEGALTQMESAQQNELANAKAVAKSAMAELSSLTIAQQACIGCTGDGYDSFGMRCSGPPQVIASVKGGE